MAWKKILTEEQVGFAIGYTAAFVVDNFVKVSAVKYGYKAVGWIASKTRISPPTGQVLFERVVDGVADAY